MIVIFCFVFPPVNVLFFIYIELFVFIKDSYLNFVMCSLKGDFILEVLDLMQNVMPHISSVIENSWAAEMMTRICFSGRTNWLLLGIIIII